MDEINRLDPDEGLLRRYSSKQCLTDGSPTSFAFVPRKHESGLSVYLERLTSLDVALGQGLTGQGIAVFAARVPQELGLSVRRDPIEDAPGHCLVEGNFSKSVRRRLAENSRVLQKPDLPDGGS